MNAQEIAQSNVINQKVAETQTKIETLDHVLTMKECPEALAEKIEQELDELEAVMKSLRAQQEKTFIRTPVAHLNEKYGANVYAWPRNEETEKFFEAEALVDGHYSEAALEVLGINSSTERFYE